jgi:hypothetical protein
LKALSTSHTLCAMRYGEQAQIENIFAQIAQYLSQGHIVVYITDAETTGLFYYLERQGIAVEDCIEQCLLAIFSRSQLDVFLHTRKSGDAAKRLTKSLDKRTKHTFKNVIERHIAGQGNKKVDKKSAKGANNVHIFIINPVSSMPRFASGDNNMDANGDVTGSRYPPDGRRLADHESLVDTIAKNLSDVFCFYDEYSLSSAPLQDLLYILQVHRNTLHTGWLQSGLQQDRIVEAIKASIDKSLGAGTGRLILDTMKLIYKVNAEVDILNDPERFEDVLQRILGAASANVIREVKQDIVSQIRFDFKLETL